MITKDNLKAFLIALSFEHKANLYTKTLANSEAVDLLLVGVPECRMKD